MKEGNSSGGKGSGEKITPSVFETLGGKRGPPSSEKSSKTSDPEPSGNKRKRLSRIDDRNPKKVKMGEDKDAETLSVFERLGTNGRSGSKNSGDKNHNIQVTAPVTNRSTQRMVLGNGKIVEEGLMDNTNPSTQI